VRLSPAQQSGAAVLSGAYNCADHACVAVTLKVLIAATRAQAWAQCLLLCQVPVEVWV
jgi:hypothetical protein